MRIFRLFAGLGMALVLLPACSETETTQILVPTYDPPLAFPLTAPLDGDPLVPTTPTLRWSTSLGAFSYRVQVSSASDFSVLVLDEEGVTTTSYQPPAPLAGSAQFWWRVYGINGTESTLASNAPWSFTTVSSANLWQTVGSDAGHSGYNAAETGTPPLTFAWNFPNGSAALHPVVYEGGLVFVTNTHSFTNPNYLYAVNLSTGLEAWKYDFGDVNKVGQPSVWQGRVFVGQNDHTPGTFLWSFNASDGAFRWASPVSSQWETYWAPVVAGNAVYMNGGYYGGLYGFHPDTGAQLFFNNQLEQYDQWSPAFGGGELFTFVAGKLRTHHPTTGAITQTVTVTWNWAGWSMMTSPVIGAGRVYVIAPPVLYCINPATGLVDWETSGFSYTKTPAVAGTSVYGISGGTLRSLNAASGAFQWAFPGDTALSYPPVVAAGHVYVSSSANTYAVRVSDGVQVWTAAVGGWLTVAAGKLFIARPNGVLTAYSLTP